MRPPGVAPADKTVKLPLTVGVVQICGTENTSSVGLRTPPAIHYHLPAVRNPLNLHKLYIPKLFYITLYN